MSVMKRLRWNDHCDIKLEWPYRSFFFLALFYFLLFTLASVVLASMVYDGKVCRKEYPMV